MKEFFCSLLFTLFLWSCSEKQRADLIIHHAVVYTVDTAFTITEAIAIKDGKILATGTTAEILAAYEATEKLDAEGKSIFPGFIDAHCHFVNYGLGLQQVNLVGTASFEEVMERVQQFAGAHPENEWIIGRGWDQNDWKIKEYPDRRMLDSLFPNTPVMLTRIDGHAALANGKALELAGIDQKTKINGGELLFMPNPQLKGLLLDSPELLTQSVLSGVLIDNAVDLVSKIIPEPTEPRLKEALLAAQQNCFAVGLTTVDDAGLMKNKIDAIDRFQKSGELKMRVYAMLSDSAPNYDYYLKNGPYKTERLNVCSFKFYGDGALGSRGACLLEDYSDKPGWRGFLLKSLDYYQQKAEKLAQLNFQVNTHCIGDSAVQLIMDIYRSNLYNHCLDNSADESKKQDHFKGRRWRIEHLQVFEDKSIRRFCTNQLSAYSSSTGIDLETAQIGIIPSVQPTHATSDMYWAAQRLGEKRVKNAYAYKQLLQAYGIIALGTDFPVEDISPFKTFYAAVARKDSKGFPESGFQMENALTREETIKGMTTWAAYANFEEKEKGSIEKGKFADLVILDKDIMKCPIDEVLKAKVLYTFLNGEKVYQLK